MRDEFVMECADLMMNTIDSLKRQRKRMQKAFRKSYVGLSGGLYARKLNNVMKLERVLCPCGKCYRVSHEGECRE